MLLLLSYTLLAVALVIREPYEIFVFILITLSFIAAVLGIATTKFRHPSEHNHRIFSAAAAAVFVIFIVISLHFPSVQNGWFVPLGKKALFALLFLTSIYFFHAWIPASLRKIAFWTSVTIIALTQGLMIGTPLKPHIDVYFMEQESAEHLLRGLNPYSTEFHSPYSESELSSFGHMKYYSYPPSNLYLQTAGYLVAKDIRFVHLGAMILTAIILWLIARKDNDVVAEQVSLLFVLHPAGPKVLESAWTEPLIVVGIGLFLMTWIHKKDNFAAAALGYVVSLKHYMAFALFSALVLRPRPRFWIIALLTAVITIIPFALWAPTDLLTNGFLYQLSTPKRDDSLSITSFLLRTWNVDISGKWLSALVGIVATVANLLFFRNVHNRILGFLLSLTLILYAIFFLGGYAFINYYYLVSGLLLYAIALEKRCPPASA